MGRMGNLGRMGIGSRGNRDTHWKGGGNDGAGMGQAVGDGRKRMSRGAKGGECGAKAPRTVAVGRTGLSRGNRDTHYDGLRRWHGTTRFMGGRSVLKRDEATGMASMECPGNGRRGRDGITGKRRRGR